MKQNSILNRLRRDFYSHFTEKRNEKAVELANEIISLHKSQGSDNTKTFADDLFNIALLYDKIGDYENSIRLYSESLKVLEEGGCTGIEQTYRLGNIAIAKCKLSHYDNAITLFTKVKDKLTALGKTESIEYIKNLYNLGSAYLEMGRNKDAAASFLAAEKNMPKAHREGAFDLIDIRCALGYAQEALEDYDTAIASLGKALFSMRKFMPDDMLEISKNTFYLANVCLKARKYDLAIEYFVQTMQLTRKLSPNSEPYYPRCLTGIADAYAGLGQFEKSIQFRLESLEQISQRIGENHIHYANCLRGAALVYKQLKEYKNAEEFMRQSLDIRKVLLGECNTEVLKDTISLMEIYVANKDTIKAINVMSEALAIIDSDPTQADYGDYITQLARIYMNLGDINDLNDLLGNFEIK